jgi:predicted nucleic acid-binding protein
VTSRLSLVESARALLRVRESLRLPEERLVDAERSAAVMWERCELWEITPAICDAACRVAPRKGLRALDAIHAATYLAARRRIEGIELVTVDERLREAVGGA